MMSVALIVFAFMAVGAIIFTISVLRMFSRAKKNLEAIGGLEGLKAAHLQMTEEHPAAIAPLVSPVGSVQITRLVWLILALSALAAFGVGGFFQYRAIRSARLLESEGVTTRATVTEKRISEDDDGDETYYVTYTFVPELAEGGAQSAKRKESVPYEIFTQVEERGRIDVIYARSDPKVAQIIANYTPGKVSYLPILLGGIFGLVEMLLGAAFYRRFQNAMRLDGEGLATSTTILDLFATSDSDNTSYYVAYTLPDGQKIRHSVGARTYKQLRVGDVVRLVYLPDNPKIFRPEWPSPEWGRPE